MPRRVLQGVVTSDKMDKTITVLVERKVLHQKYKKYVKQSAKYAAHDEGNVCKEGDVVSIEECRPISQRKSWVVLDAKATDGTMREIKKFEPAAPRVKQAAPVKKANNPKAAKKAPAKKTTKAKA